MDFLEGVDEFDERDEGQSIRNTRPRQINQIGGGGYVREMMYAAYPLYNDLLEQTFGNYVMRPGSALNR